MTGCVFFVKATDWIGTRAINHNCDTLRCIIQVFGMQVTQVWKTTPYYSRFCVSENFFPMFYYQQHLIAWRKQIVNYAVPDIQNQDICLKISLNKIERDTKFFFWIILGLGWDKVYARKLYKYTLIQYSKWSCYKMDWLKLENVHFDAVFTLQEKKSVKCNEVRKVPCLFYDFCWLISICACDVEMWMTE